MNSLWHLNSFLDCSVFLCGFMTIYQMFSKDLTMSLLILIIFACYFVTVKLYCLPIETLLISSFWERSVKFFLKQAFKPLTNVWKFHIRDMEKSRENWAERAYTFLQGGKINLRNSCAQCEWRSWVLKDCQRMTACPLLGGCGDWHWEWKQWHLVPLSGASRSSHVKLAGFLRSFVCLLCGRFK